MAVMDLQQTQTIELGRQGENLARAIEFDLTELRSEYGAGTAVLVHVRPGDSRPYIADTTYRTDVLTWPIVEADVHNQGTGKAEIRWYVGDVLVKTAIFNTLIIASIMDLTVEKPGNVVYMTGAGASVGERVAAIESMEPMLTRNIQEEILIAGSDYSAFDYPGKKGYKYYTEILYMELNDKTSIDIDMLLYNGSRLVGRAKIVAKNQKVGIVATEDFTRVVIMPNVDINYIDYAFYEEPPITQRMANLETYLDERLGQFTASVKTILMHAIYDQDVSGLIAEISGDEVMQTKLGSAKIGRFVLQ